MARPWNTSATFDRPLPACMRWTEARVGALCSAFAALVLVLCWPCHALAQDAAPALDPEVEEAIEDETQNMMQAVAEADGSWFEQPGVMITPRSAKRFATLLGADTFQADLIDTLYEGYRAAMKVENQKMAEAMRSYFDSMRDPKTGEIGMAAMTGGNAEGAKRMGDLQASYMESAQRLEKEFLSDIRLVLLEDQVGAMERVERFRRRERVADQAMVSGAGVDILTVLEAVGVPMPREGELHEAVLGWERAVDRPATSLFNRAMDMQKMSQEMTAEAANNPAGIMDMMTKLNDMMGGMMGDARAMRDENLRASRQVASLLTPEQREAFDAAFQAAVYPRIYRTTSTDRLITAATGLADLSESQRNELALIQSQFVRDRKAVREQWAKVQSAREDEADLMSIGYMMFGQDPAIKEQEDKAGELEKDTRARVLAQLTEEQRARLPEIPEDKPVSPMMEMIERAKSGG